MTSQIIIAPAGVTPNDTLHVEIEGVLHRFVPEQQKLLFAQRLGECDAGYQTLVKEVESLKNRVGSLQQDLLQAHERAREVTMRDAEIERLWRMHDTLETMVAAGAALLANAYETEARNGGATITRQEAEDKAGRRIKALAAGMKVGGGV